MCAVRNHAFSSLLVFTSRTRSAPRLLGVPEYAMVVFAAPQLRENEELRNDPSSFEGRARTDKAAVKTRHPGDCVATRAGGSKEWGWTRSAPAPPSSSFRGCAASWIDGRHLRIVSSQGLGRGAQPQHHRAEVHKVSATAEATLQPVGVPPVGAGIRAGPS